MSEHVRQKFLLHKGAGASLALHVFLIFLCLYLIETRPEPGGSGLVLDVFLVEGGDGFYQKGAPWAKPDDVSGRQVNTAVQKISEEMRPLEKKGDVKVKAFQLNPAKEKPQNLKKADASVLAAFQKKPSVKKKPEKNSSFSQNADSPVREEVGRGAAVYGGAVGDALGYGAGQGRGIGVGAGRGVGDVRMARYFVRIRRLFQHRLMYPVSAEGKKLAGKAVVRFHMLEDGKIVPESIRLIDSSGQSELDQQALKTVKSIPFLPKPPGGAMTIDIPIIFRVYR